MENGERVNGFVVLFDPHSGIRHAVRPQAVTILADVDESYDDTLVYVGAGRVIRVGAPLERVLDWLWMPIAPRRLTRVRG
jgi:hypothetical protein